ncbi:MAG: nucleotidyltransferase family protein [Candidatus Bathyarchaeota archaeon]|nr:MAG: nucleotidyltransferase family protein [Candidatus Bathyarchaeota archaeon]
MGEANVKGVVLAGGQGTRFRPLTYYFQKCMIPVGEHQKPVLEYIVRLFAHHRIEDLILLVGYKHEQVRNYFNDGSRFGVRLGYVLDKPDFKGSANAIVNAYREGAISEDDCVVAYFGDILSDFDLNEMVSKHLEARAGATVALTHGFKVRVGTAEIEKGLISRFIEKPELELPVSVGIVTLSGSVLEEMDRLREENHIKTFDLMGDFIPHLIEKGIPVKPYVSDAFWYDLGSLERYESFENDNLSKKLSFLT